MFRWIRRLLIGKSIQDLLAQEATVRVKGVKFRIKKIGVMSYLDGSKVMLQHYDIYKNALANGQAVPPQSEAKIREHFTDVLMAGVVHPKLSRKQEEEGVLVDDLFLDWDLVNRLYTEIVTHTYGKKKLSHSLGSG